MGRKNNKKFNKTLTHDFLVDKIKETMTNRMFMLSVRIIELWMHAGSLESTKNA